MQSDLLCVPALQRLAFLAWHRFPPLLMCVSSRRMHRQHDNSVWHKRIAKSLTEINVPGLMFRGDTPQPPPQPSLEKEWERPDTAVKEEPSEKRLRLLVE